MTLTVVRNDTRTAMDQQSWIICWMESDGQTVCFKKKEKNRGVIAKCRLATHVTAPGCGIYLLFIKADTKMRSGKCRGHPYSRCELVSYCVVILATMIAITAEKGDITGSSWRALLPWSDPDWGVRLTNTKYDFSIIAMKNETMVAVSIKNKALYNRMWIYYIFKGCKQ